MISAGIRPTKLRHRPTKGANPVIEPNELVRNTLKDLYLLLEDYAPEWYTEELHERAEAALLELGN